MAIRDLQEFVGLLESRGELCRIAAEVDPVGEIAAITDRVSKGAAGGRALCFERVKGHPFAVLTNLFGSARRTAWALGVDDVESLAARFACDLGRRKGLSSEKRLLDLLQEPAWQPVRVDRAPCQEVIERQQADLTLLPALQSWPGDGGRYLTLPQVFTRGTEGGQANCGMYRIQILDARHGAIHWGAQADGARHFAAWKELGEPMPMAVAVGGPPLLTYAAGVPLPAGIDEGAFAGYLGERPVEMTRCLTCDLEVPAVAEFVIEGVVLPDRLRPEGPFGNHTGYYVPAAPAPVFRVSAITSRKAPVYPATVVGPPPMEDCFLAKATERLLLPLLRIDFPALVDLCFPVEGIFHGCALFAVQGQEPGRGRKLIDGLWRKGLLRHSKLLVAVDAGVDVQTPSAVFWKAINHIDPQRDVVIDGQKIGLDATHQDARLPVVTSAATEALVSRRWDEYGLDRC